MAPRLFVLLPRLVVIASVFVLATGTLTFAAQKKLAAPAPAKAPVAAQPVVLTVPDVQRQAYVFAKGILEDHGFAWRIDGGVQGFAANSVASQTPAPGTRVIDTGAPLIVLRLTQNTTYEQDGTPENTSPYRATPLRLANAPASPARQTAPAPNRAAKPKPTATKKPKPASTPAPTTKKVSKPQSRPPAFVVPGAPKEPLDEMPLPDRARQLSAWIAAHPNPTNRNVQHWLYQHSWIVTGAKFGWWRGAEALELLIEADRRAQATWGVGGQSAALARAALAQVEASSR